MEKREQIAYLAANADEAVLLARVYERMTAARQRSIPAATCFLSPREQALCVQLLRGQDITFFGGFDGAERRVCVYLPEYLDESWLFSDDGPIAAVRASFHEKDTLSHRDILGGLMGCGIKRETVGDICLTSGCCDFFLTREILPYVLQNFTGAGRTKLHPERIALCMATPPEQSVKQIRSTLASLRLDAVMSTGFGLARGKAAAIIESGRAELNHIQCLKPDRPVAAGDVITVRGLGKLRLESVGGHTKKDRISVTVLRYL